MGYPMHLTEVLEGVEILKSKGALNVEITGIEYDSRKIKQGNVFICVAGYTVDGHQYIKAAVEKGAAAIIVEKDIEDCEVPVVKVESSRRTMAIIASNFYQHPSKNLKLIGITGTNGKTTTTYLVKSILEQSGNQVGLLGTIEAQIGNKRIASSRTTPESLDLQKIFKEMVDSQMNYAVMEVSSHALALGRTLGCEFRTGVFTNLTQDHLDFHHTIEDYRDAKTKLFYETYNANIINIDDPHGNWIMDKIKDLDVRLLTYGIDNPADIMAIDIVYSAKGVNFTLLTPEYTTNIELKIPGKFNVYNCLAAAAVAYIEGTDKNCIREGLKNVDHVQGRSQVVDIDKPFTVIIDYAHSPDGLKNIITTIKQYAEGKVITLFGCGGDRDKEKRPIMGEIAGRLSDYCIVTSDNPRSEEPMEIIRQTEQGVKQSGGDYICIENRRDAIKYALHIAKAGDVVLIAGKGHETYQILKDKTISFDEKEIVIELLKEDL